MKTEKDPVVSIGIPVYNGEKYLVAAIDSFLAQTLADFELIIADNGSTDRTPEICLSYASADSRVQYHRSDRNRGAAWNFNHVFSLARGPYFKWAAHDDVCLPQFLELCVAVLDQHPSVVLCHPKTSIIDEHGRPFLEYVAQVSADSEKAHVRFRNIIGKEHWCYQVFGVMRTSVLRETPLIGPYSGSDRVLLAELSLKGRIREIPQTLFLRREHPETSTNVFKSNLERMKWFDPERTAHPLSPELLKLRGYVASIKRASVSPLERSLCTLELGRCAVEKVLTRLYRKVTSQYERSHLAVPVEGVEWQ